LSGVCSKQGGDRPRASSACALCAWASCIISTRLATDCSSLAAAVRQMVTNPQLNRLLLTKLAERMVRLEMLDTPRPDQQSLSELRTASFEALM